MDETSPLQRRFRLLVFDWDGAVPADAAVLYDRLERLVEAGALVVATTASSVRKVAGQLGAGLRHRRGFYLCAEGRVWTFSEGELLLVAEGVREPIRWARDELAPAIPAEEVLLAGDGGGADAFVALVGEQATLWPLELSARIPDDPSWLLVERHFRLAREHEIESICAVANGRAGTRGSLAEGSRLSAPATFLAGAFETPDGPRGVPELARLWDWTALRPMVDGKPLDLGSGTALRHGRVLDLRQALLWRDLVYRDAAGRITDIVGFRLASQTDRSLLVQELRFVATNYCGDVRLDAPLKLDAGDEASAEDGRLVLARQLHRSDGRSAAMAIASRLIDERGDPVPCSFVREDGAAALRWEFHADLGHSYRLERLVAVGGSQEEAAGALERHLRKGVGAAASDLVRDHVAAWAERWSGADVRVDGDPDAQQALRFATYHLISAANPEDEHVSIGARTLSGAAYKGHVFWDTEIFMLPFFSLTWPEAARALLRYRWHTLPAARAKARRLGYRGALFAWESTDDGDEKTPPYMLLPDGQIFPVLGGTLEQHISADVAWAVWNHWQATGDESFLLETGAEIVLETARFWASRVTPGDDGLLHILDVVGPDEYHEHVDDDAYTNWMAAWNLACAASLVELLRERWPERARELLSGLSLDQGEPPSWRRTAQGMYLGKDPETGLIEQFRGYFDLQEVDLRLFPERSAPMDMLLGHDRIQRTRIVKQADVVLLLQLFWESFTPEERERNFRFYEERTGHGSSLSPPTHALVAARLGDLELAERYLRQTIDIDLADNMGNASGGVHAAAAGGLWQAVAFGFAGLALHDEAPPTCMPHLPDRWRSLELPIVWRGERHRFELGGAR